MKESGRRLFELPRGTVAQEVHEYSRAETAFLMTKANDMSYVSDLTLVRIGLSSILSSPFIFFSLLHSFFFSSEFLLWNPTNDLFQCLSIVLLGGVMTSVLNTGPMIRGFNPGRGR
jgi:hypothetical protein